MVKGERQRVEVHSGKAAFGFMVTVFVDLHRLLTAYSQTN